MREKDSSYPKWKMEIIKKYLPEFTCESYFQQFISYLKLYKDINGNLDIKRTDTINGFPIGTRLRNIKRSYENGFLKKDNIEQLEEIGLYLEVKHPLQFDDKIELAQEAIGKGVIISNANRVYKGINFYTWIAGTVKIKYANNELTKKQICVIEKLVSKPIYTIFNNGGDFIKVIDVLKNEETKIYSSKSNAIEYIRDNFGYPIHVVVISNYLNGKCKSPYKGRFIFEHATDEEVKKYLEDNKAS